MDAASRVKQLGTILGVWAHPDDEVFTCGGILSIATKNGQEVMCMTATRGEAGVQDESLWPSKKLGEIRTSELEAAYDQLGVKKHCWFEYPDGGLMDVPFEEGVETVKQCIVECNPDVILTFGPDGMTGHDDHRAVATWAFSAAKEQGIPIYQAVITPEVYEANRRADERFDMFFNIDRPPIVDRQACDLCIDLDDTSLQQKCEALKAMPSQTQKLIEYVGEDTLNEMQRTESFVLAT